MQFTPRSALEAPLPLTGASFGPAAPVPLPVENPAKAAEIPRHRMSQTAETILHYGRSGQLVSKGSPPSRPWTGAMAQTGAQDLMPLLSASSTLGGRP